ncbi:hypothetical protein JL721_10187 [Aureococcus anophagefferens]|nr:hypothetical protein JL721_10187 [Aureococcus anophagefferens]
MAKRRLGAPGRPGVGALSCGTRPSAGASTSTSANFFDGIDVRLAPALADVDGDGDLDLVVGAGTAPSSTTSVGSAASPSYEAVTGSANPFDGIDVGAWSKPAFADVDGDGDLDLVVGEHDILFYYENVGSATSPSYEAVTGAANPFDGIDVGWHSAPALADLDGDGDLDLVVGEEYGTLFYYENVGSAASPDYAPVTGAVSPFDGIDVGWSSKPALADVDGDGDLDLVVGEDYGTLFYYENVGSAASPSYEAVTGAANPFDGIYVGQYSAPALADLDSDGDLDLVVGDDGSLYYYGEPYRGGVLNYFEIVGSATSPSYEAVTGAANPFDGIYVGQYSAPALADLDGDGDLDLVVGEDYGVLFYYENLRRLGGDGDLDLVVGEKYGAFYYYENVGNAASPTYAARTGSASPFDGIDVGARSKPAFADVDGDGDLDLVVGEHDGILFYYENVGSATSPSYAARTGSANPFDGIDVGSNSAPALADVDGDGDLDLVVGEHDGVLSYYENVGSAASPSYEAVTGAANFDGIDVGWTYQGETGQSSCALADAGFFVQADGASEQTACDAGKYSGSGADECVDCEAGTYQDATGQSSCALADAGSFVQADGASEQTACDAGKYSGSGASDGRASEQTACDAGKYSGSGADECVDCEAGTYQDATGQSSCALADAGSFVKRTASEQTACDAGKYSGSGADECVDCEAGTYQDATGQSSCALADGGSFVKRTASEQTACDAGKYSGSARRVRDCAAGTYQDATGQSSCALADGGRGSGPCLDCAAAKYADEEASSDCKLAEAGSFVASTGASASTPCFAGSYAATASSECATCEVGTYSTEGSDTCTLCPSGYSSDAEGASECEACPVGKYKGAGSGPCLDCAAAKYADEEGSSDCKLAEAGSFVGSTGASASTACFAGTAAEASECSACPVGTFKGAGSGPCVECGAGTFGPETGQSSCLLANSGFFVTTPAPQSRPRARGFSGSGASECDECERGTYQDATGQASCALADGGSFVDLAGAPEQTSCPAGSFSGSGASECVDCEIGTFSGEGESSCTSCPAGYSSSSAGASECSACPVGTFKGAGSGPCIECGVGTYGPETGQSSCALADAGSFVNETGASTQTLCDAGKISGSGATECDACQPGTFADERGGTSCQLSNAGSFVGASGAFEATPCPAGSYSGMGASACTRCEEGTFAAESGQSSCALGGGTMRAPGEVVLMTIRSSLALNGVDASAFNDDAVANAQLKAALEATLVADLFSFMVDSAGIASVGPAVANGSSAKIWFELEANYTAAAGEDLMSTEELVLEDFELDLLAKIEDGTLQRNIEEADTLLSSISTGDAQSALDDRAAGTSLASAAIDEASSAATITGSTEVAVTEARSTTDALVVECPAGTISAAGESDCTPCSRGTYSDALGQTSCKLASPGTFVPVEGASAATPCPVGTTSGAAASSCAQCPLGYYSNLTGQSSCQLCETPTTTLEEGKTYCDACREAYYWDSRKYATHADKKP